MKVSRLNLALGIKDSLPARIPSIRSRASFSWEVNGFLGASSSAASKLYFCLCCKCVCFCHIIMIKVFIYATCHKLKNKFPEFASNITFFGVWPYIGSLFYALLWLFKHILLCSLSRPTDLCNIFVGFSETMKIPCPRDTLKRDLKHCSEFAIYHVVLTASES